MARLRCRDTRTVRTAREGGRLRRATPDELDLGVGDHRALDAVLLVDVDGTHDARHVQVLLFVVHQHDAVALDEHVAVVVDLPHRRRHRRQQALAAARAALAGEAVLAVGPGGGLHAGVGQPGEQRPHQRHEAQVVPEASVSRHPGVSAAAGIGDLFDADDHDVVDAQRTQVGERR